MLFEFYKKRGYTCSKKDKSNIILIGITPLLLSCYLFRLLVVWSISSLVVITFEFES